MEERVTVGRRFRDVRCGYRPARSYPVLYQHLLVPHLAEALADEPRNDVGRIARGERDDIVHGLYRVGLRVQWRGYRENHRTGKRKQQARMRRRFPR